MLETLEPARLLDGAILRLLPPREAALTHDARHDPLTELANRNGLDVQVAETDPRSHVAVFFAVIDQFKRINDEFGHDVGDSVVIAVAQRFEVAVRPDDLVARVGGDEIVVWAPDITPDEADGLAARLVDAVSEDLIVVGRLARDVTVTVGVAVGRGANETTSSVTPTMCCTPPSGAAETAGCGARRTEGAVWPVSRAGSRARRSPRPDR